MKIALCLSGIVGGKEGKDGIGGPIDFKLCFNHYKKHILDINDVDVFIHSWSTELALPLIKIYKPKKHIFESQVKLRKDFKSKYKVPEVNRYHHMQHERSYCRWVSQKKVIELKQQYEKENNFQYDWVMTSRFDTMFFVDVPFNELDPKYFYVPYWNKTWRVSKGKSPGRLLEPNRKNHGYTKKGFQDIFSIASSEKMNKFSTVLDYLEEYNWQTHQATYHHIARIFGNPSKVVRNILYRWWDFEIYRIKVCECYKVVWK